MTSTPAAHLQARDISLLSDLGEYALLDTDTLHARHFPNDKSCRACRRRLRLYKAHGLIQTVHVSVVRTDRPGRMPAIHRLTIEGADVIHHETGVRPQRTARSEPPKTNAIFHRLGMAKVHLAMNDACGLHGLAKPKWILEYDSYSNVPPNAKLTQRYILCREFTLPDGKRQRSWPDAACQLTIPSPGKDWRLTILWEYDRSTEGRDQLTDKLKDYEPMINSEAWRHFFPNSDDVRIFFVVPSLQRLRIMTDLFRDSPLAGSLRFAVVATVLPPRVLQDTIWSTTTNEWRSILPRQ